MYLICGAPFSCPTCVSLLPTPPIQFTRLGFHFREISALVSRGAHKMMAQGEALPKPSSLGPRGPGGAQAEPVWLWHWPSQGLAREALAPSGYPEIRFHHNLFVRYKLRRQMARS